MKFNIKDLKVGQIVYVKPIGNAARWIKGDILEHVREVEVEKIGNKFFYLKGYSRSKFGFKYEDSNSCTNISDYCADYEIYLSKQDIVDELEQTSLLNFLKDFFSWSGKSKYLTLEQLRKIKVVVDELENEK